MASSSHNPFPDENVAASAATTFNRNQMDILESLQNLREELQNRFVEENQRNRELKNSLNEITNEIRQMGLENVEEKIDNRQKNADLCSELDALTFRCRKLEEENQELRQALDEYRVDYTHQKDQLESSREKINEMKCEKESLLRTFENCRIELEKWKNECIESDKEKDKLEKKLCLYVERHREELRIARDDAIADMSRKVALAQNRASIVQNESEKLRMKYEVLKLENQKLQRAVDAAPHAENPNFSNYCQPIVATDMSHTVPLLNRRSSEFDNVLRQFRDSQVSIPADRADEAFVDASDINEVLPERRLDEQGIKLPGQEGRFSRQSGRLFEQEGRLSQQSSRLIEQEREYSRPDQRLPEQEGKLLGQVGRLIAQERGLQKQEKKLAERERTISGEIGRLIRQERG